MIFRELPQFNGKYFFTKIQTNDNFCFLVNTQYGPESMSSRQKGYSKRENLCKLVYFLIHF